MIQGIEIAHPFHQPRPQGFLGEAPVERTVMVPFPPLAEFPAHEQELLAGMSEHQPVERAKIREFPPVVPGIFPSRELLPCTTSSWESGSTKFSL